jgi:birA, biotin-[acetyl-CoA-carboxylase] ligase region
VVADTQLKGRGQHQNTWHSKPFKNLTCSVLVRFKTIPLDNLHFINYAVSLAIYNTLKREHILNLSIKWPNDIMAGSKKICGILIENTIVKKAIKHAVVGVGLNVNQLKFPKALPSATSLAILKGKTFNLQQLLDTFITELKSQMVYLERQNFEYLEANYLKHLYKINTPAMFKDLKGELFMGIIRGVTTNGHLKIELENGAIKAFCLKEVVFV